MTEQAITRPRAVLFDWDNTLIDSWKIIHEVQNIVLEAFGQAPWTLDDIRVRVRKSMRDAYPALFGERWEEAGRMFQREYETRHLDVLAPLPGAADLLETLSASGFYLGVVSNKRGDSLRKEARHLGWDKYFSALVGAADAVQDKPSAAPVAMALAPGKLRPGRDTWFVGDTDIDMLCARRADCVAVLLRPEAPGPDEFTDAAVELHFADGLALSNYLLKL